MKSLPFVFALLAGLTMTACAKFDAAATTAVTDVNALCASGAEVLAVDPNAGAQVGGLIGGVVGGVGGAAAGTVVGVSATVAVTDLCNKVQAVKLPITIGQPAPVATPAPVAPASAASK